MFPRVPRKLQSGPQPNPHDAEQRDIDKVSPQDVVVQRKRKQRRGGRRSDHALNRDHRLRDSIRSAERPLVGCRRRYVHKNRALKKKKTRFAAPLNTHMLRFRWGKKTNLPNPMAEKTIITSCSMMSSAAAGFRPLLEWRIARFSKGNNMYTGTVSTTLVIKTRRGPKRPTMGGNAKS